MNDPDETIVHIDPVLLAHYMDMLTPPTIAEVAGRLRRTAADAGVLQLPGDERTLRAARAYANMTLLDLGTVPAPTPRALRRKARAIGTWSHLAPSPALISPMLEAALRTDARRLRLPSAEQDEILSTAGLRAS